MSDQQRSTSPGPSCSIVIPARNRSDLTARCLDAVLSEPIEAEIIVVDDGSEDDTQQVLARFSDDVRTCSLSPSLGFAEACNRGASLATTPYLIFLNNDTVPQAGWTDELLGYAECHPDVVAVGAKLVWPDGVVQHAGVVITAQGWPHHAYRGFPADHPAVNRSRRMAAVTAACMLVRRERFEAVGGFDPAFHNGYEDVDLCLRLAADGGEVHYCCTATVHHDESATRRPELAAGPDPNLQLLLDRWRDRAPADDIATYVTDGLIELHYPGGPHPVGIRVDPVLASVVGTDADNTLPRLLNHRTRQVFDLLLDLERDAPLPPRDQFEAGVGAVSITGDEVIRRALDGVDSLAAKISPLRLASTATEPPRINVLVSTLDPMAMSAADVSVYEWIRRLRDRHTVRVVALDDPLADGEEAARIRLYEREGLDGSLGGVEVLSATRRAVRLRVNPSDRFVATSFWTAHLAHHATVELGQPRFLYLIADHEPLTLAAGSARALADQAYTFPHVAAVASPFVHDYLKDERIGVYADGLEAGDSMSMSYRCAITGIGPVTAESLERRGPRRVLLVARPRALDDLSLFELAVVGLRQAVSLGVLDRDCEFLALGAAAEDRGAIPLAEGAWLEMIPRQAVGRYRGLLRTHDIGLSLTATPKLGLAALDMAAAGMLVITAAYGPKTAASVGAVSGNIDAVPITVQGVLDGLRRAANRLDGYQARAAAAEVAWSRSWDQTFDDATLEEFERLLSLCHSPAV
jgi:GT2 family glycosyltransferase